MDQVHRALNAALYDATYCFCMGVSMFGFAVVFVWAIKKLLKWIEEFTDA